MATQRQLLDGYNSLSSKLVRGAGDRASAIFTSLGSWRDSDYADFVDVLDPIMTGAKIQAARLQVAFYSEMAKVSRESFEAFPITAKTLTTSALRNGADTGEVYRRPFVSLYTALSNGGDMTKAISEGARRISSIASTDMQLARRAAGSQARDRNSGITYYVRTLTGNENCALCTIASTQRYTRGELMPIHPGCDCGEMPVFANQDPGQVLDQVKLDSTYDSIEQQLRVDPDFGARDAGLGKIINTPDGGQRLADYTEIVVTRNHGEYGPTLSWRDQSFTGPGEL